MAWNKESKASRRARVAKQLRDKHGKWIEMGGGVKWFKDGKWHDGTASAFVGNNVEVTMKDGSKQLVNHREIEPIRAKGSLGAKPTKPAGSVQAKKAGKGAKTSSVKDNDPAKRLTSNASDLEEGDEVYLTTSKGKSGYGLSDEEAAKREDDGFDVHLDDNDEPKRARVVDTSGDKVTVEDSDGKRSEISKNDNVLQDDQEMDAALQNSDEDAAPKGKLKERMDAIDKKKEEGPKKSKLQERMDAIDQKEKDASKKSLGDTLPEEMRAMPNGTVLDAGQGTSFRKDDKDSWQRVNSDGQDVGAPSTSAFLHQNLENKDAKFLTKDEAAEKFGDRKGGEAPKGEDISLDAPKNKVGLTKEDTHLPLDGLDLTDAEKKRINDAETGEEALKALKDSEAGDYLPIARQNKNKAFVDAYRKAVNDINDKHQVVEKKSNAPAAEEKKSEGTPIESLQKTIENLNEDLGDIDSKGLEGDKEAEAIKEATYDFKSDDGEVFNLNGSRDENGDWNIAVSDSDGNVVANLNPKDAKSSQELAQAIKDSTKDKSSSEDSGAPTEAPEVTPDVAKPAENTPKANVSLDELEAQAEADGDTVLYHGGLPDGTTVDDIDLNRNGSQQNKRGRSFGGFYLTDKSSKDWSDKYAEERNGVMHGFAIDKNARIDDRGKAQIDRLSEEERAKAAKDFDVIMGKDLLGRTQYVLLNKDVVKGVGETNLKDDKASDAPKAEEKSSDAESNGAPLNKALKDAGFTDEDIAKIENAKDETEAEKEFFQSPSGKKASDKQIADKKTSPEYEKARKAFEDFKHEKFPTGKAESDKKVEENKKSQERADKVGIPEAEAEKAKSTIESGKKRDADRVAKNTPEAKLAEIDRKIAAGEKMIDDAKKKDNQPLADRIQENVDNLKKQREKLAPSEKTDEAPAEESNSTGVGEPFDSPENGVAILADKTLNKTEAGSMKVGDKFFAQRIAEGKFAGKLKPISGGDVRVKPDGESWTIKDIKSAGGKNSTWEVEDSKGQRETLNVSQSPAYDEVARRSSIVQDTAENRDKLGFTKQTEKSDSEDKTSDAKASTTPTREEIVDAFDKLEADAGKIKAKTVDETIAQAKPQPLGNGMSLELGKNDKGALGYSIKDENGNEAGFVPFSASDKSRADAVLEVIDGKKSEPESSDSDPETKSDSDSAPSEDKAPEEEPAKDDKSEEEPTSDDALVEEEQKLVNDAKDEIEQELESEKSPEPTPNVKSTIQEALQDIEDELGDSDWETLKERTWPVEGMEDDLFIGIGKGSTEDDKFLGLYDKDDNELETYDMKGLVNDIDERDGNRDGADDGRDDSGGGSLDRGASDVGGGDSGRDETGERARVVDESQSLVDEVKRDDGEAEGELRKLDDEGYSLAFEPNERSGRQQYVLRDNENNVIARFGRKDEDNLPEKVARWRDAHRVLRRAFSNHKDSDERNVNPTPEMQRAASIGTRFTKDDTTYTKISPVAWGYSKKDRPNDIEGILGRTTFNAGQGEYHLGHTFDDHKSAQELDAMSDEELAAAVADFDRAIHDVIAKDGPIGDKGNMGRRVTDDDQELMQRLRFQALAIHDEAREYSQRLWDRQKDGVLNAAPVDTGEFNSSAPRSVRDGSIDGEAWMNLRNEYVGLDHRTLKHNFDLRNSEKPSRGATAWGNKMDKWAGSSSLENDSTFYRSVLASPETTSQFKPGSVFVDKGVMSVGGDKNLAEVYLENREPRTAGKIPTVFTIEAPAGSKVTQADPHDEGEFVVPRNAKLFISSAEEDENGILRVTARLNPSDEQIAAWTNKSTSSPEEAPTDAPEAPESTLKPLTKLKPNASNAETQAFAEEYWEERMNHLTPERKKKFEAVEKTTEDLELEQLDAEERNDFKEANRIEAEIDALRSDLQDEIIANRAERIAASKGEKPETVSGESPSDTPKTISGESPTATPDTVSSETPGLQAGSVVDHPKHGRGTISRMEGNGKYARVNFDKYDDPKKTFGVALSKLQPTGESKTLTGPEDKKTTVFPGESTASVGAWSIGERVNHGKHGVGTIQRLEGNGEFARVHFDKDGDNPKRTYGVKLSKLGKGESGTPSSIKDPSTKVGDQKPKEKVNSGTTETRNVQTNDKGEKFILGKNDAELYVGAVVIHPKFGRGRVVKLENNGKYARVVFDNDPTATPRGIVGAKLEDESIEKEVDRSGFVEKPTKK